MDVDLSVWRDKKISEGLKQWDEWDKMTYNHAEPGKEAKYPDPLGAPLDYIESHDVFKPINTRWGSVGTFQSSLNPVSLQPMTTCLTF